MARVLASERTRKESREMFAGKAVADKSSLVRQAARLIVEGSIGERSGRCAPERLLRARGGEPRLPQRLSAGQDKSAEGEIEFAVPQLAETAEPFRSKIREVIRGRTEELQGLIVDMYARGLSGARLRPCSYGCRWPIT